MRNKIFTSVLLAAPLAMVNAAPESEYETQEREQQVVVADEPPAQRRVRVRSLREPHQPARVVQRSHAAGRRLAVGYASAVTAVARGK